MQTDYFSKGWKSTFCRELKTVLLKKTINNVHVDLDLEGVGLETHNEFLEQFLRSKNLKSMEMLFSENDWVLIV